MLEDRIIVQDRGIDAGLAALMQNANRYQCYITNTNWH